MRLPSTHGIKRSVLVKKRSSNSIQENSEPIQTRWKKDKEKEKEKRKSPLTKWICLMLLVKGGHRPLQIILKPGFQFAVLDVRLRRIIVISVNTKLGSFEEQSVFSVVWFFFYIFQANVRWALWTKKKSFLLFRVFWRALYGVAMCISERKLKNTECIDQIKRGISLVKVCLTCKNHATFLENSELFITRAFSISGV